LHIQFSHFSFPLQTKAKLSLASPEARNRDKEQDRENDRDARSPRDSRSTSRRRSPENRDRKRSASPKQSNPGTVLYVGNLGRRVDETDIRDAFEKYGRIASIEIVKDPYTNECRGFAFVKYENSDEATDAVQALDNSNLDGRKIRVEKSKRDQGHGKSPGEYLGHYKSRRSGHRRSPSPRYNRRSPRRRSSRDRYSDRRDKDYGRDRRRSRDRYRSHSRDRSGSRSRRRR